MTVDKSKSFIPAGARPPVNPHQNYHGASHQLNLPLDHSVWADTFQNQQSPYSPGSFGAHPAQHNEGSSSSQSRLNVIPLARARSAQNINSPPPPSRYYYEDYIDTPSHHHASLSGSPSGPSSSSYSPSYHSKQQAPPPPTHPALLTPGSSSNATGTLPELPPRPWASEPESYQSDTRTETGNSHPTTNNFSNVNNSWPLSVMILAEGLEVCLRNN